MTDEQLCYWLRCEAPIRKDHPIQIAASRIEQQAEQIKTLRNLLETISTNGYDSSIAKWVNNALAKLTT